MGTMTAQRMSSIDKDDTDDRVEPYPMTGSTFSSTALDVCVVGHSVTAFLFATMMLIHPNVFSLFSEHELPDVALDAIRWACPFVFGFSWLAAISLHMTPRERQRVAWMYSAAFTLACCVGTYVQTTGRWSAAHAANIMLFASLAVMYLTFLIFFSDAFYRPP